MPNDAMSSVQRYAPPLSAFRENAVLIFGMALFAGLLVLLGWLGWRLQPDGWQIAFFAFFGLMLLSILGALLGAWCRARRSRRQCALLADDDGLWLAHLERAQTLVRWADIDDARYDLGSMNSGLVLQGRGRDLLRIDRRLTGYEALCAQVFWQIHRPAMPEPVTPTISKANHIVRWFLPCLLLCGALFLWWKLGNDHLSAPLVLLVIAIGLAVCGMLLSVQPDERGIRLTYSGFRKPVFYRWDEVDNVRLQTLSEGPVLHVALLLKTGRMVLLRGFTGDERKNSPIPCIYLYRQIRRQFEAYCQ